MKTKMLLSGMLLASLTACVSSPVRDDAPATDLEVLRLGVHAMTEPREVQGPIKHPEDARSTGQAWGLLLELDDIQWLSNGDKLRIRTFVDDAIDTIAASRLTPCRWWELRCWRSRGKAAPQPAP